jgi:hypothetical protein
MIKNGSVQFLATLYNSTDDRRKRGVEYDLFHINLRLLFIILREEKKVVEYDLFHLLFFPTLH